MLVYLVPQSDARLVAHPTGFEPVTSAFGELVSRAMCLRVLVKSRKSRRGKAQNEEGSADILRTRSREGPSSVAEVVRMVMAIDLFQGLFRHAKEPGGLPRVDALLHQPSRAGMAQS